MKSSYMLKGFKSTVGPKDIPTCKQEGGILIEIFKFTVDPDRHT